MCKINIWEQAVQPSLGLCTVKAFISRSASPPFMNGFDSDYFDTKSWPSPHMGRLWRWRHFEQTRALMNHQIITMWHWPLSQKQIIRQTNVAFDWLAALFLFQRVKRQSKPTKAAVSLCVSQKIWGFQRLNPCWTFVVYMNSICMWWHQYLISYSCKKNTCRTE